MGKLDMKFKAEGLILDGFLARRLFQFTIYGRERLSYDDGISIDMISPSIDLITASLLSKNLYFEENLIDLGQKLKSDMISEGKIPGEDDFMLERNTLIMFWSI